MCFILDLYILTQLNFHIDLSLKRVVVYVIHV